MRKTLIASVVTLGLGILSTPSFGADGYAMNERPASASQAPLLVPNNVPLAWPSGRASLSSPARTEPGTKRCYYVLDVLLCD